MLYVLVCQSPPRRNELHPNCTKFCKSAVKVHPARIGIFYYFTEVGRFDILGLERVGKGNFNLPEMLGFDGAQSRGDGLCSTSPVEHKCHFLEVCCPRQVNFAYCR